MTPFNQSIKETDYLTWESCADPRFDFYCPPPKPLHKFLPEWFKNLRGNIREYLPEGFGADHTLRHCLGFRGLLDIGYSIALPVDVGGWQTHFASGNLHPEMLHGTPWADKPGTPDGGWIDPTEHSKGRDFSPYKYRIKLLFWPWRAKMAPGWRLLMTAYTLDWRRDLHAFTGYVEANHGSNFWGWSEPMDPTFNYYNVETVVIMQAGAEPVPAGQCIFSMIPVYEPGYVPRPYAPYPF